MVLSLHGHFGLPNKLGNEDKTFFSCRSREYWLKRSVRRLYALLKTLLCPWSSAFLTWPTSPSLNSAQGELSSVESKWFALRSESVRCSVAFIRGEKTEHAALRFAYYPVRPACRSPFTTTRCYNLWSMYYRSLRTACPTPGRG